jgi:hypothetical protein
VSQLHFSGDGHCGCLSAGGLWHSGTWVRSDSRADYARGTPTGTMPFSDAYRIRCSFRAVLALRFVSSRSRTAV